jgi:hypothetical protein
VPALPATCRLLTGVVIFDFGDRRKRYLDNLAIGAFYLDAWSRECLSGFHAPDNAADALAVNRYDLNIVFAVQRLKCRKCLCDFHVYLFSEVQAFLRRELFPQTLEILHWKAADVYVAYNTPTTMANLNATRNATGKLHLAYTRLVSLPVSQRSKLNS